MELHFHVLFASTLHGGGAPFFCFFLRAGLYTFLNQTEKRCFSLFFVIKLVRQGTPDYLRKLLQSYRHGRREGAPPIFVAAGLITQVANRLPKRYYHKFMGYLWATHRQSIDDPWASTWAIHGRSTDDRVIHW